jgi:hypothetical protein
MHEKSQASLEYIIMLAISLGVFTAILYVVNTMIAGSSSQVGTDSAFRAVEEIKEGVDFVYIHGDPSKTQVTIYIPPNIQSISIDSGVSNREINIRLDVYPSYTDVYAIARTNISAPDLTSKITHEGYYLLDIESDGPSKAKITVK